MEWGEHKFPINRLEIMSNANQVTSFLSSSDDKSIKLWDTTS